MIMSFPGIGGDNPHNNGNKQEGVKSTGGGEKKPMNTRDGRGKGKPPIQVSEDSIRNSDQTQAFALMKLSCKEWWKRKWETTIIWCGSVFVFGVAGRFALGGLASGFSIALPEGASKSTQVGYVVTDATTTVLVAAGKNLLPGAGRIATTAGRVTKEVGATLVSIAIEEQVKLREQVDTTPRKDNTVLARYNEVSNNTNQSSRRRSSNRANLLRLPK
jgi:hypothetical protein